MVVRLYASLGRDTLSATLGKQCLRSGTSVGANYREAYRARSRAEFIAKLGDCLKEAEETAYWLELMKAESIMPEAQVEPLLNETSQLIAIFVSSLQKSKTS